jgi:hypothetical protein
LKRFTVPGLVVMLAIISTLPAWAHAELVSASPGPGEVVPEPLTKIVLMFDDEITDQSQIQLIAANFQLATNWSQTVENATLTAVFEQPLPPGTYTVIWTAVTPDGHTTTGSYQFALSQANNTAGASWPSLAMMAAGFLVVLVAVVLVWRQRASGD